MTQVNEPRVPINEGSALVEASRSRPAFAAFLSYDRDDAAIGVEVHRALEGLGGPVLLARPPFFSIRARRVFRDVTNIATSPDLRAVLRDAMRDSSHFILLASPRAAASEWIAFEIESWLALHDGRADNLLILLADGEILWDDDAGDFDWQTTNALPRVLAKRFAAEPVYSDLRSVVRSPRASLSLRNSAFRSVVAELVAAIEGRSKDEVVGRHLDVRRRIWTGTALAAIGVAALAGGLVNRAQEVSRQRIVTGARQSLAQAAEVFTTPGDPDNWPGALRAGLTQAQTAVRTLLEQLPVLQAVDEAYMRDILETLPGEVITLPVRDMNGAFTSDDGRRVLLEPNEGTPLVWDIRAGRAVVAQLPDEVVFDGNLRTFAWQDSSRHITVDASGARTVIGHRAVLPLRPLTVSGDGNSVAYTDARGTLFVEDARGRTSGVRLCQPAEPTSVVFSRARNRVAAVCGNRVMIWTADGSRELASFTDTLYNVVDAEFTDDGTRVAIATARGVRLWSVDPKELLTKRQIVTDPDEDDDFIDAVGLDASGSRAAINIDHEVMTCIDLATGETVWPRIADWDFAGRGQMAPVAMSKTVAYREVSGGLTLFDVCTGNRLARIALEASSRSVTYNDRSRRLTIVTPDSGTVHIVNLRSADLIGGDELVGQVTEARAAARAPVEAVRTNEHLLVWNTETGERLLDSNGEFSKANVALSDDGSVLALYRNDTASVWRCPGRKPCGTASSLPAEPLQVAATGGEGMWVSPDYLTIFTRSGSALFRVTPTALQRIPLAASSTIVEERPVADSGLEVVLVDSAGQRLLLADVRGGDIGQPRVVASGPAGEFSTRYTIVSGPQPGTVTVLDTTGGRRFTASSTAQEGNRLGLRTREYTRIARSEDGRLLAVATESSNFVPEPTGPDTVEIVDVGVGQLVNRIALDAHVSDMAFGRNGQLAIAENAVAARKSGFRVRVFERDTWKVVTDIQTAGRPTCLSFSADGALLAVGQRDNTTSIVDRSGLRRLVIPQAGRVVGCAIFDGSSKILTIGSTTDLTVLRVTPATRAGLARRLLGIVPWVD